MTERIHCCIPGCRRSGRREGYDGEEIICGKHWRTIDTRLRERHKLMRARDRKVSRLLQRKVIQTRLFRRNTIDRLVELFTNASIRAWEACKLDATIKAAMHAEDAPRRRPAA